MEELKIIQKKENSLFERKEISAEVGSKVVPSRAQVCELLSKKFSTSQENIKIKKIDSKFGSKSFSIEANIYKSKEEKERVEVEKKKDGATEKMPVTETKEESKQEEKIKEAGKAQEQKPEEKVEENKPEEKQEPVKEEVKKDIKEEQKPGEGNQEEKNE